MRERGFKKIRKKKVAEREGTKQGLTQLLSPKKRGGPRKKGGASVQDKNCRSAEEIKNP